MAARRMFAKSIAEEDQFLSMPVRAQLLYFYLGLEADDDGVVDRVLFVRKMLGASQKDLNTLIDRGYLIALPSGIVVITHWRIHNHIRKDTYTPSRYAQDMASLEQDQSGVYRMRNGPVTDPAQDCPTGKGRQDQERINQERSEISRQAQELGIPVPFLDLVDQWFSYKEERKEPQSPATIRSTLVQIKRGIDRHGMAAVEELILLSITNGWQGIFFERLEDKSPTACTDYGSAEDIYS